MALILDGTTGVPVTTVTGTLPVANGGTGVTTSTGTGAVVRGTSPTITGATITVAATAAPAFSAYASVAQSVSNSTWTKVTFGSEDFDTNSNFASSTFTPTVAGYYQFNCGLYTLCTTAQTRYLNVIYKNGSALSRLLDNNIAYGVGNAVSSTSSILVYANGTTDYFEMYGYLVGTGTLTFSTNDSTNTSRFSASMVRSA